jgi:hypothetical protein
MSQSADNFFALFVKSCIKNPTNLVGVLFGMYTILNNNVPVPLFKLFKPVWIIRRESS